jgi:hypothetical protein
MKELALVYAYEGIKWDEDPDTLDSVISMAKRSIAHGIRSGRSLGLMGECSLMVIASHEGRVDSALEYDAAGCASVYALVRKLTDTALAEADKEGGDKW